MIKKLFLPALLLIHLALLISTQYTVWPEMILYPYLLNHGFRLYTDVINPYFPLLPSFLLIVFNLFGQSVAVLKILTYILILLTDLGVFYFVLKLTKNLWRSLFSLSVYVILQIAFEGNGLWFELALTPIVITSFYLIYFRKDKWSLVLSGALLGLSALVKQNALLYFLPAILLVYQSRKKIDFIYFLIPPSLLFIATFVVLFVFGIFSDFLTWAVRFPLILNHQPGFILLPTYRQYLSIIFLLLPIIFVWEKMEKKIFWVLIFFISLLFAFPRFEAFHLQVLVAFAAILLSLADKKILSVYTLIALLIFVKDFKSVFRQTDRFLDSTTYSLASEITPLGSVYLLNAPELSYFLAQKLPPKPWATNFPWYFEGTGFQQKFISSFAKQKISTVVIGERIGGYKYALGNYIPEGLINYIYQNYNHTKDYQNFEIWQIK